MVAHIGYPGAADHYLSQQQSRGGEELDGRWYNPHGLFDLEDDQVPDPDIFARMYMGLAPVTHAHHYGVWPDEAFLLKPEIRNTERALPGIDISFSADKSISVLWAIADKELRGRIEQVQHMATRIALQEIFTRECSYGKVETDRRLIRVVPGQFMGVIFQHGTKPIDDRMHRSIVPEDHEVLVEHDDRRSTAPLASEDSTALDPPNLHTHALIFNLVYCEEAEAWLPLHKDPFDEWQRAAGACYRAYLLSYFHHDLGIAMERYGEANALVRVKHIPKELEERWAGPRGVI